jgi:ceramide glucosyltransferase
MWGLIGLLLALAATWLRFRQAQVLREGAILPMTLIKPIRGLDEELAENLESIALSDSQAKLQTIIAIESPQDPAYPVAQAFARNHPEADIMVLLTGPSGDRMGKIHNMIEAIAKAKHPRIIFSDADVRATTEVLLATSRAFEQGFEAIFALPYHRRSGGLGGLLFQTAFNHSFAVFAALSDRLGNFRFFAGAWMAYRRETLEGLGGLSPFAHEIADDYAIGTAAMRAGAKISLLSVPVFLRETSEGAAETFNHLAKWSSIIHACLPGLYDAIPLMDQSLLSFILCALCFYTGLYVREAVAILIAVALVRAVVAFAQDRIFGSPLPWFGYALLPAASLVAIPLWISGFRSTIDWRGTRYKLRRGGRAVVVASM